MVPLTQPDFLAMLITELHLRGAAIDRGELLAWVSSMWPWIEDDPDAWRWAGEFLEARRGKMLASGRRE
jgi:hypothetical protein